MHSFSVKELDQLIENDLKEKKKSSKLLIGYKLFNDLIDLLRKLIQEHPIHHSNN
ncbi:hypothetical protein F893_03477 [Acinetobacter sp. CIP 102136]|nr:hypothetical protein F893_03477 [Acinetobacter sp. CIP 102136]